MQLRKQLIRKCSYIALYLVLFISSLFHKIFGTFRLVYPFRFHSGLRLVYMTDWNNYFKNSKISKSQVI